MFEKVLVCNRGEVAVRIVRACRDLGVRAAVAYSSADRDSLAVRLADDAVCIGPGPAGRSYNNVPAVLYGCAKTGADAVHPGYGFLSEDPVLAAGCEEIGVTFIGPSPEHIALMGDKIAARAAMRARGVPVLPGSDEPVVGVGEAGAVAADVGYPVAVKAVAGGGGRGIAIAHSPGDLVEAFEKTRNAARALFHDDRVYVEKYLPKARHVEVQVLADTHGGVVHLGERDCSVQHRHQKLVEESPSPGLGEDLRDQLLQAAVAGTRGIGYTGAGTFEFLVAPDGGAYFIEMNTRLQVEHPVTEARSGVDVVAWMIRIASGEPLTIDQNEVRLDGHVIEARINAEDLLSGRAGPNGPIRELHLPGGPGVRVDTHVFDGYLAPPYYDSLLAKIVVSGPCRASALRRLERALGEFRCEGPPTNIDFHRELIDHPEFRSGEYGLGIVESMIAERAGPPTGIRGKDG